MRKALECSSVFIMNHDFKSMQNSAKVESAMSRDKMPIKLLYVAIVGAAILLMVMAWTSAQGVGLGRGP